MIMTSEKTSPVTVKTINHIGSTFNLIKKLQETDKES